MHNELDVEGRAEPADGNGVGDDHAVSHPYGRKRGDDAENCPHLENRKGNSPSNRVYRNDGGRDDDRVLPDSWPKVDHSPGLVHERTLDANDQKEGEDGRSDADVVVGSRNMAVVSAPEGKEVIEWGGIVNAQQGHADGADEETSDVEHIGESAKLGRGRHNEESEEHDEACTQLRAIVDANAGCLSMKRVDKRQGNRELSLAISGQEGNVLSERVEIGHVCEAFQGTMSQ